MLCNRVSTSSRCNRPRRPPEVIQPKAPPAPNTTTPNAVTAAAPDAAVNATCPGTRVPTWRSAAEARSRLNADPCGQQIAHRIQCTPQANGADAATAPGCVRPQPQPGPQQSYNDASTAREIEKLRQKPGPISGQDFQNAIINGTKDADNRAATAEYQDLKKFAEQNWDRLSPEAREKWRVYERCVEECQGKGMSGIPMGRYNKMVEEMSRTGGGGGNVCHPYDSVTKCGGSSCGWPGTPAGPAAPPAPNGGPALDALKARVDDGPTMHRGLWRTLLTGGRSGIEENNRRIEEDFDGLRQALAAGRITDQEAGRLLQLINSQDALLGTNPEYSAVQTGEQRLRDGIALYGRD